MRHWFFVAKKHVHPSVHRQAVRLDRACQVWTLRLIGGLVLIAASTSAFSEHVYVYRWTDPVDGDVHYDATAHAGEAYDMLAIQHAPPAG